jgi:hypothetical protein
MTRMTMDAKASLNQKNYILKAKTITAVKIDELKENIRLKIGDDTEDYTNGVNGDKMDTNVIEHRKGDQEINNTGFGKVENNKHPSAEGKQHTFSNKLKEDLQIMWHKVRLLQIHERVKLPKIKTNSKLIKLQEEINGAIEELLEEEEMDVTDINNVIYAAATIMTQTLNEPSKRSKNRRNVKLCKIRMQKQISNWRKELSIMAETGTGSDNGKPNRKKRKILQKYRVTNAREVAQLTETLKQKVQAKAQRIRRYEKGKPSIVRIKCLKRH